MEKREFTGSGRAMRAAAEALWLGYYNDALFQKGLISERERNRMRIAIEGRAPAAGDGRRSGARAPAS